MKVKDGAKKNIEKWHFESVTLHTSNNKSHGWYKEKHKKVAL
jgi:hypothetical protein